MSEAALRRAHDAAFFRAWARKAGALQAVYTPPGGAPVACQALVDHDAEQFAADADDAAPVSSIGTTVTFRLAELAPVVPGAGGTVTVDDVTYTLAQRLAGSDGSLAVWAVRAAP